MANCFIDNEKILLTQTWVRPMTPVINGSHSYAVAWSSKREDGLPYAFNVKLESLGLKHDDGYVIEVMFHRVNDIREEKKTTFFCRIILFNNFIIYIFVNRIYSPTMWNVKFLSQTKISPFELIHQVCFNVHLCILR